jgi:hypothetical protein
LQIESHKVFIHSEDVYGVVEKMGAFASLVIYEKNGVQYEELLENDDLTFIGE